MFSNVRANFFCKKKKKLSLYKVCAAIFWFIKHLLSTCLKCLVAFFLYFFIFAMLALKKNFFLLVLFSAYLHLRCTTRNEVLEAIESTKNNCPQATFNSLTKQEGIICSMEKPLSGTAVSYSDTEVKQTDASLDCLLRNATEGYYIRYLLQPTGKQYITADWTLDVCAYEATACILHYQKVYIC